MGGIAGLIDFRGEGPSLDIVRRMSARVAHRGPDGEGEFAEGPIAIAHRLRKTVPSRSVQPVVSQDLVVVMDGWLFDAERVLKQTGHREPVRSDTEVLLAAWRKWTFEFTEHIDGAFAAAFWNRRTHTLTLFRDKMGTAPLFWAHSGPRFAFASELPALLEVPWVGRELAREHLSEYLSFRAVHAPRTLLRGVHQVEPAHWLRFNGEGLQTRRYWQLPYAAPSTPQPRQADTISAVREAVSHAVQRRLAGGAPTGLYLSGGLGSTVIAAAAHKLGRDLPTFTLTFADDAHSEQPFAARIAKLLGFDHHEVVVGANALSDAFPAALRALGHPMGNPSAVLQLALAKATREHVRVVLSGDGGEELFGGRMLAPLISRLRAAAAFGQLPFPLRKRAADFLANRGFAKGVITPPDRWGLVLGLGGSDQFSEQERRSLLADPSLVRPRVRQEVLAPFYQGLDTDPINAVLNAYVRSWLQDGSLVRWDRTSAAVALDIRFPLLDQEVVTLVAGLPGSFKLPRGRSVHTRWALQEMISGTLPAPLVNRPKRGMPTPVDRWLAGPGRLFMEYWCSQVRANRYGLWQPATLMAMRREVLRNSSLGVKLWTLIMLQAWLDEIGAT
ncbi:MAG: asparagine synthase (glutamine-hydrolyzing) [Deltaproteobacteria bacterium]|nr:asparagine synthase (glutamine-hydrolyzing) [Deltaproteobacteria bacterium]